MPNAVKSLCSSGSIYLQALFALQKGSGQRYFRFASEF